MTIDAELRRLVIASPDVARLASFYDSTFDYRSLRVGDEAHCEAADRSLWIRPGPVHQLLESHFAFHDAHALDRYVAGLERRGVAFRRYEAAGDAGVRVEDPEGRGVCFFAAAAAGSQPVARPSGRLQHYAVRTPVVKPLADFYETSLGFVVSDLVRDDAGDLSAVFLRTDSYHHALAIFRSPERRLDHFSCETGDWNELRDWADRMAAHSVPLAWGVGRHGPGNDTFFMVLDSDGNLVEISSDLEHCAEDRPVGLWKHRRETLNLWGVAIMRS